MGREGSGQNLKKYAINGMTNIRKFKKPSILFLLLGTIVILLSLDEGRAAPTPPPCPYNTCQSGQSCDQWYNGDAGSLCCITACDADQRSTNLNPSFPRVAMQRPVEPQKDISDCKTSGLSDGATPYIHSKYDLVAFTGISDGCTAPSYYTYQGDPYTADSKGFAREIKAYSPETIVLGRPQSSPIGIYDTAPIEYFVMKDVSTTITQPVAPGSTSMRVGDSSFLYEQNGWLAFLGRDPFRFRSLDGSTLNEVWGIDMDHAVGERVLQPVEVFGYTPNLMPFNPLADYRDVAKLAVDQRYAGLTIDDFQYYDGVFYSELRDRILCADDLCGATYWKGEDWGADFNNNGIRDCNCDNTGEFSMSYLDEQWHIGIEYMFRYERQVLESLMPGRDPIIVTNSGDYAATYMDAFNNGYQLEYLRKIYSWNVFMDNLTYWEKNGPEPHVVVIIDTTKEGDYDGAIENGRNEFNEVRYGLATASMGGAYYGRNFGWYHYIGSWYDEFDTDLGYPTSDIVALDHLCTDTEATGIQPDWSTYECIRVRFFDKGAIILNVTGTPQTVTDADLRQAWTLAGFSSGSYPGYYKIKGGQQPDFNTGESFASVDLQGGPGPVNYGAGDDISDAIFLFTEPTTVVSDIVIGNWHNDDTSPGSDPVVLEPRDAWSTISWSDEKLGANPYYTQWVAGWTEEGKPYFYTSGAGKTATFRPTIGVPGEYEVYEWHGWHADRNQTQDTHQEASNIQATIQHAGGGNVVTVDQTGNYGQWNYLGTYIFGRGTNGYVRYSTDGANGVVIADAVMFKFTGNTENPSCSGDVNTDGKINILDIQELVNINLSGNAEGRCADVNNDGVVNGDDTQFLINKLLGW
jgi:hypothetical protein